MEADPGGSSARPSGGQATHLALRDLALHFDSWQFVGVRARAAQMRREEADATAVRPSTRVSDTNPIPSTLEL